VFASRFFTSYELAVMLEFLKALGRASEASFSLLRGTARSQPACECALNLGQVKQTSLHKSLSGFHVQKFP
jgi:hypothetical protein